MVSTKRRLRRHCLAALYLRHAADSRAHRRITRRFRARALRPRQVRSVAQHPTACSCTNCSQSRVRVRHLALARSIHCSRPSRLVDWCSARFLYRLPLLYHPLLQRDCTASPAKQSGQTKSRIDSRVELVAIARGGLAVEIEHDERDSEQRLENFLQKAQGKSGNIKAPSLLGFSQLLQKRLRILCGGQLMKVVLQGRPFGNERDCQHKREPQGRNEGSAPQRALKPGKIAPAIRKISAVAQCIDELGVFENGKLLPKQNVHEETTKHPNLQNEQSHREKDQQQRSRTGKSDACDDQPKEHYQGKHAIDEDAQRSNARPEP